MIVCVCVFFAAVQKAHLADRRVNLESHGAWRNGERKKHTHTHSVDCWGFWPSVSRELGETNNMIFTNLGFPEIAGDFPY